MKEERLEFLPYQIHHDSIIVDGHTGSITFEALRWLAKDDITLTLLNWNGNLLSTTLPLAPKSGKLRVMQYAKYLDAAARLGIASEIVKHKIAHTKNMLRELARYYREADIAETDRAIDSEAGSERWIL